MRATETQRKRDRGKPGMLHCRENGVSERRNVGCSNTDQEEGQDQALHSVSCQKTFHHLGHLCSLLFRSFVVALSVFFLFRDLFVFFCDLGKLYAYSPYKSLLISHLLLLPDPLFLRPPSLSICKEYQPLL